MWYNRKKYIILTGASGCHYGSRLLNGYLYLVENETCGRLRTITVRFPRTFSVPRCVGTTEKPLGTRYSVGVPRRCVSRPPRHRGRKRSNRLERRRPSVVLQFSLWKPAGRREKWMMVTINRKFLFVYLLKHPVQLRMANLTKFKKKKTPV